MSGSARRPPDRPTNPEQVYIYSEEDLQRICGDVFVDLREIVGDEDAAECLDVIFEELTDDFHGHTR